MRAGFTLVELLITITIIAIATAAIIPSFSSFIRNQNVKQAQEQLKSDLRNVQNKALTGALSDATIGTNPVLYWGIRFTAGTGTGSPRYETFISAVNTTCPSGAIPAAQLQGYAEVTTDLQVKATNNRCIYFSISNGDISTVNFPAQQVIVGYINGVNGDCRRILFNSNGLIYTTTSVACS